MYPFGKRGATSLLTQVTAGKMSILGKGSGNWMNFQVEVNSGLEPSHEALTSFSVTSDGG